MLRILPALLLLCAAASADDWPQFRGPNRDGVSAEKGLLAQWPQEGPKVLWAVNGIGQGFTHVAVAGGTVFVTGMKDKNGVLTALTLDGKIKWFADYGGEWYVSHPGARSIPTVFDGRVYVASGTGNICCFDAGTGKEIWTVKLFDEYQAPQVKWGYAESLLIDGDHLIATPCGKKGTLVALDRRTGQPVWASPDLGQTSSFCSPVLVEHKGVRMIVTMLDASVVAFSPADGSVLWRFPYKNFRGNHCDSPIYYDGLLYVTSGYGKGAVGLGIAGDGKSVKPVWEQPRQDPVHGQAVLVDGFVYAAGHQSTTQWTCVDFRTGKLMWEAPGVGKSGSAIAAGGMLYCYSEDGFVGLMKPNPQKCEVVGRFKVLLGDGDHWAHPVVSGGRLYIRHGDALMCYDVSAGAK